jgi:hypothetical protein
MVNIYFSYDYESIFGFLGRKSQDDYNFNFDINNNFVLLVSDLHKEYELRSNWAILGAAINGNLSDPVIKNNYLCNRNITNLNKQELDSYTIKLEQLNSLVNNPYIEIGCHSFFHQIYWESDKSFLEYDLQTFNDLVCNRFNLKTTFMVFPKNVYSKEFEQILINNGISHVRINPDNWLYNNILKRDYFIRSIIRVLRALDYYLPIIELLMIFEPKKDVHNTDKTRINYTTATLFLRGAPTNNLIKHLVLLRIWFHLKFLAFLKKDIHLWTHPYNFTKNKNDVIFLEKIFKIIANQRNKNYLKSSFVGILENE